MFGRGRCWWCRDFGVLRVRCWRSILVLGSWVYLVVDGGFCVIILDIRLG